MGITQTIDVRFALNCIHYTQNFHFVKKSFMYFLIVNALHMLLFL